MKKRFVAVAGGFLVALSAGALMLGAALRSTGTSERLPVLWSAPAFSCGDQRGLWVSDRTLRGHVWVSGFFYSGSSSIGPMMMARMADLRSSIVDPGVRFVSISVDPDRDTPELLKQYATLWTADERWHFLSADRQSLAKIASGMKTFVKAPAQGATIQHTSLFTLVDQDGRVRGVYDSLDDVAMGRLAQDVARLTGVSGSPSQAQLRSELTGTATTAAEVGAAERTTGAALFAARGCVACHAQGRGAPPLARWFGRTVVLSSGRLAKVDEAYVRESILDPGAKVVAGFSATMPSYRGQISDDELVQLVAYLKLIAE